MRIHYVAEYDGGVRTVLHVDDVLDADEAYRTARRMLAERTTAHRVEVWTGGVYVTRATRGFVVEDLDGSERVAHDMMCMETCCIVTARDEDKTKGDEAT